MCNSSNPILFLFKVFFSFFFFFNDTATTEIYTLSLHDALPICKTIDRIVNAFPVNQQEQIRIQLSTVLQAVISQLLLPRCDKAGRVAIFEIMINTPSIAALIRENKK